jgi:hypothetical protein
MGITNRTLGLLDLVRRAVPRLAAAAIAITLSQTAASRADESDQRQPLVGSPFGIAAGFL